MVGQRGAAAPATKFPKTHSRHRMFIHLLSNSKQREPRRQKRSRRSRAAAEEGTSIQKKNTPRKRSNPDKLQQKQENNSFLSAVVPTMLLFENVFLLGLFAASQYNNSKVLESRRKALGPKSCTPRLGQRGQGQGPQQGL